MNTKINKHHEAIVIILIQYTLASFPLDVDQS